MYLILKRSFRLNLICFYYHMNFWFHWKTLNFILLPNLGFCFLEGLSAFLRQRLERYTPLIFFPTSHSHVLKLIASGNEDALVSAVKSVFHFLRQVDIY